MIDKRPLNRTLLLIASALAVFAGYQSFAVRQVAASRPANVAWIDIERVFEGLSERALADQQLTSLAEKFDASAQAMKQKAITMEEELEILAPGSGDYKQAEEMLLQKSYEYRGYMEFAKQKLELRKAQILGRIYEDIRAGAQQLSQQHGFDYVMVNDSLGSMSANTEAEMNRQISARRILFATSDFDATDLLIEHLNSQ
jgi:Skp family chaperone for outer membrane proteins